MENQEKPNIAPIYKHIEECHFSNLRKAMSVLEQNFEYQSAIRTLLYRARILVGDAMSLNRENMDRPQLRRVKKGENNVEERA